MRLRQKLKEDCVKLTYNCHDPCFSYLSLVLRSCENYEEMITKGPVIKKSSRGLA